MNKLSTIKKQQLNRIFSNQILEADQTFVNSIIDYTMSGINGDIDTQWKILFNCVGGSIDAWNNNTYIRLNNDSTAGHYINPRVTGGHTAPSNEQYGDTNYGTNGLFIGQVRLNCTVFSEILLNTTSGKNRQAHVRQAEQRNTTDAYSEFYAPTQFNTSSVITSFVFYCPQTITYSRIRVYKYQDIS